MLQHKGVPPHFGRAVTEFSNEVYGGRWTGRGTLVAWPARSPDFNPIDFFLWSFIQSRVYHGGKPEARHQLVEPIDEVAVGIRNELVHMQWQQPIAQRLAACMQSDDGNFKHVL
jgi:hypothetical protein